MTQWSNKGTLTGAVQDSMKVMLLDKTRPNTKDQNILATLAMLRDYITGGMPIPPPDTEWVTMPTVSNTGFVFNVDGTGVATFPDNPEPVTYAATSYTVPAAAADLKYVFLIYAKSDGTYGTVSGAQSQNPAVPSFPADALYVSHAIVSETAGTVQEPPQYTTLTQVLSLLGDYLPKDFQGDWQTLLLGGAGLEIKGAAGEVTSSVYFDHSSFDFNRLDTDGATIRSQFRQVFQALAGGADFYWLNENAGGSVKAGLLTDGPNRSFYITFNTAGAEQKWEWRQDGKLYLNGVEFTAGGGGTPVTLYPSTGQNTDGAMTQKAVTDAIAIGTGALTHSGTVTVPLDKDGVYHTQTYPATVAVSTTTNVLGKGAVLKITANGTTAPTVTGATRHNSSANFNTTNGTVNSFRVWCEHNGAGAKTNFFIWTQQ